MARIKRDIAFDEILSDEWGQHLGVREVPLANQILIAFGGLVICLGILFLVRIWILGVTQGAAYASLADANLSERRILQPPRGMIYDRNGALLAGNKESFLLYLDLDAFLAERDVQQVTLDTVSRITGMSEEEFWKRVGEVDLESSGQTILLQDGLETHQAISFQDAKLPTLFIEQGIRRTYPAGRTFSSLVGYTGLVGVKDREEDADTKLFAAVGKTGIERTYDVQLRGRTGESRQFRDARGASLGDPRTTNAIFGEALTLTIDKEFQEYFAKRFEEQLRTLGKTTGVGIAMDPRTGEVLALLNFPLFDNEIFVAPGKNTERKELLTSSLRPLFNRAVSGMYNPGSTIKPLVGVAALSENVITPEKSIYSPGYLDVPNPYDPTKPSRFLDWQRQGWVNLTSALAKSSNVYFYVVGGGFGDVGGLGITKLHAWWQKFHLGSALGIDLPGEASGTLPTPEEKTKRTGEPWRLGDTFNVSIGQGDLLVTPFQLLTAITSIANRGTAYVPYVVQNGHTKQVAFSIPDQHEAFREVEKGMVAGTQTPEGTAHLLGDLPIKIAAKTGTAQVANKTKENALFVGYGPVPDPQIAILVLIENSREGSANTIPVARDVFEWYYLNRIKKNK